MGVSETVSLLNILCVDALFHALGPMKETMRDAYHHDETRKKELVKNRVLRTSEEHQGHKAGNIDICRRVGVDAITICF